MVLLSSPGLLFVKGVAVVAFGVSGPVVGGGDLCGTSSVGVGLSGVWWRGVARAAMARVLLVVGLASLLLVWFGGAANADQSVPIPMGRPMADGSYAVCSVGYVWIGIGHGAPWDTFPYASSATEMDAEALIGIAISCNTAFAGAMVYVDVTSWDSSTLALGEMSGTDQNGQAVVTPQDGIAAGFTDCATDDVGGMVLFDASQEVPDVPPYYGQGTLSLCNADKNSVSNYSCHLSINGSNRPCDIEQSSGVAVGAPQEPYPYWAGQAATPPPYNLTLGCQVLSFDQNSGSYSISAQWANALADPAVVTSGVLEPYAVVLSGVADANGDSSDYSLGNQDSSPADIVGGVGDDFTGTLSNPQGKVSGGFYTFTVTAWIASGAGPPVPSSFMGGVGMIAGTTQCATADTNGVTPPGGLVCPDGPGTCGDLALCTLGSVALSMPDGWLMSWFGGSAQTLTFPDPTAVPGWLGCLVEEAGEWAFLPTTTVQTAWQDFGADAKSRVPVVYVYDGSTWVFSFTDELHTDIPAGYVSSACMSVTPDRLPNGRGGSVSVRGGQLCGAGATLVGKDQVVAGSSDVETLLSVILILGFAVGLLAMAGSLLRSGGK